MTTHHILFSCIVAVIIAQRLLELKISKRNVAVLLAQGAKEQPAFYYRLVIVLQIFWFLAMLGEVWIFNRPFLPLLATIAIFTTLVGQYLRYLSMLALGSRWTLPVMILPEASIIKSGIYRYLKHPNWLGVFLEIPAVPLIHSAYLTAITCSIGNAILMIPRIQHEEKALQINFIRAEIL